MRTFKTLGALTLLALMASAKHNAPLRRRDVHARHRDSAIEGRGLNDIFTLLPHGGDAGNNGDGNGNANGTDSSSDPAPSSTSTSSAGPGPGDGPTLLPTTSTSTTQPPQVVPTTSTVVVQPTTSTTSTSTTSTTSSLSTTSSSQTTAVIQTRQSVDSFEGTTLVATANFSPYTPSTTSNSTADVAASTGASGPSFMQNKTAVAATFTILGIVAIGGLVFIGFWFYKKSKRGRLGDEDMWDEASMKEFGGPPPGTGISPPSAAMINDGFVAGGLGRKNTVMPSQSMGAGALSRSRSNQRRDIEAEEPDEILALPPVTHFERPRDSAYDIVPAAPPIAAYASHPPATGGGAGGYGGYGAPYPTSSSSAGLQPHKRAGDHSSFGSTLGNDPFAGSGFTDAVRESTYGAGQAGRGAGYNMGNASGSSHGHEGHVGLGKQWPQGYNQYTGYSQGPQASYGYGYAQ